MNMCMCTRRLLPSHTTALVQSMPFFLIWKRVEKQKYSEQICVCPLVTFSLKRYNSVKKIVEKCCKYKFVKK